ncbi:MAG: hypothetical protein KGM42_13920 [Hyphomicrobiales bacterium]|nr:hypothetical protein [Hyphomicrobiales bacterium]
MRRWASVLFATLLVAPVAAHAAERPAQKTQEAERRNWRCASEGPGFIYSKETNSCIRIGGSVHVEGSAGTPAWGGVR